MNAASVAESTAETPLLVIDQRPKMSIQAAGVEKSKPTLTVAPPKIDAVHENALFTANMHKDMFLK